MVHSSEYFAGVLKRPVVSLQSSVEDLATKINFRKNSADEKDKEKFPDLLKVIPMETKVDEIKHEAQETESKMHVSAHDSFADANLSPTDSPRSLPTKKKLKLSFPDPEGVFPQVLNYMYEGKFFAISNNL